jgi:short-subunit dehydrogenase
MKYALITGASAGLGLEFARLFAKDGHSLILVARRKDALEKLKSEILQAHPKITIHVIDQDLSEIGAGAKLFSKVKAQNLDVEFLVNNAGFGAQGDFSKIPVDRQLSMIDLNIRTLVELTHLFLPQMRTRKSGRILNVGSTAGFQPGPWMTTYYASKAFVNSFSEGLFEELKGTGVTCTLLSPGATATEFDKAANMTKSRLFQSGMIGTAEGVASSGYHAMIKGKALVVTGVSNKVMVQALRFSTRAINRKIAGFLNKQA